MLKKVLIFGAVCTMTCGISFGKTAVLDIANRSLQGLGEADLKYTCRADDIDEKKATCLIRDISYSRSIGIKNIRYDLAITDSHATQKVSADIVVDFGKEKEFEKFVPKHVVCERDTNLAQLETLDFQTCTLQSEVATLKVDNHLFGKSKKFQYKTMYGVIDSTLKQIEYFSKKFANIQSEYSYFVTKLRKEREAKLQDLYSQQEILQDTLYVANKSACSASNKTKTIHQSLQQNKEALQNVRDYYHAVFADLEQKYEVKNKEAARELLTFLKQYNFDIKEIRLHLMTKKLAESVFDVYAKKSFHAYGLFVAPEEAKEYAEKMKRVYADYYAYLESGRAAAMTFIAQSPYLNVDLKKNLSRIVSEHLKLYDPNSHKRSMKVVIRHLTDKPLNIGEELEKIWNYGDDFNTKVFIQNFFALLSEYEIKAVRYWPLDNN